MSELVKCQVCGCMGRETDMAILDVRASNYASGDTVPLYTTGQDNYAPGRNIIVHSKVMCPKCFKLSTSAMVHEAKTQALLQAQDEGRAYIFPFPVPQVGDRLWEILENGRIVEQVVVLAEGGRCEAKSPGRPEAGTIAFTPFEIGPGRNLHLSLEAAQKERQERTE